MVLKWESLQGNLKCFKWFKTWLYVQGTVLYLPIKFEAIQTSSVGSTVIFLFGRMWMVLKENMKFHFGRVCWS